MTFTSAQNTQRTGGLQGALGSDGCLEGIAGASQAPVSFTRSWRIRTQTQEFLDTGAVNVKNLERTNSMFGEGTGASEPCPAQRPADPASLPAARLQLQRPPPHVYAFCQPIGGGPAREADRKTDVNLGRSAREGRWAGRRGQAGRLAVERSRPAAPDTRSSRVHVHKLASSEMRADNTAKQNSTL